MNKKIANLSFVLLVLCGILVFNTEADAQRRGRGVRASRATIQNLIRRVEERADRFVDRLNDSLDRSRLDGSRAENNINDRARDLGDATDELRREFDRGEALSESRQNVQKCLAIARNINAVIRRRRFSAATENTFAALRTELNALARVYGLNPIR